MYERFTDRARQVMQLANWEAHRCNHECFDTEHILLGLVKEGSGVAANVLKYLNIDLLKIQLEVEKIHPHEPGGKPTMDRPPQGVWGRLKAIVLESWRQQRLERLPLTAWAEKVLEYSVEESRNLGHNYIGTEHLLLGLLRIQEGVAAQVLVNLGLTLEGVREEVLNLLGYNTK